MNINIERLHVDAVIPVYAKDGDAGLDLTAVSKKIVDEKDHGYISYGTGLAMEIPKGFVGLIFPRSSISKTGLLLANAVGVVDSGYRGEIECRFKFISGAKDYAVGDKVAQLIVIPIPSVDFTLVEKLSDSDRGTGGFGSTGS